MNLNLKKIVHVAILIVMIIVASIIVFTSVSGENGQKELTRFAADEIQKELQLTTDQMYNATKEIADSSNGDIFDERAAKQALATLYQKNNIAHQLTAIDKNGVIITEYPENTVIHNKDLGNEDYIKDILGNRDDHILPYMATISGEEAMYITVPVMKNEDAIGLVSIAYNPLDMFGKYHIMLEEAGAKLVVLQTDGVCIYNPDVSQIGKIPEYAQTIIESKEGTKTNKVVENGVETTYSIYWTTVSYDDCEWRVATIIDAGKLKDVSISNIKKSQTQSQTPSFSNINKSLTQQEVAKLASDTIRLRLEQIKDDMIVATKDIVKGSASHVMDEKKTAQAIAELYRGNELVCNVVALDKDVHVVATYPIGNAFSQGEFGVGRNMTKMLNLKDIYVSKYLTMKTGRKSISSVYPIADGNESMGFLYVDYDPYDLFGEVQNLVSQYGLNLVVMQMDGIQVYDPDVWELGADVLKSEEFKEILPTIEKMRLGGEGQDTYTFFEDGGNTEVSKTICWTTLSYGEQTWSVAVTEQKRK